MTTCIDIVRPLRYLATGLAVLVAVALSVGTAVSRAQDAEAPEAEAPLEDAPAGEETSDAEMPITEGGEDAPVNPQIALFRSITWIEGPAKTDVGSIGEMNIPAGYRFTGADGAKKWAEFTANVPDPSCLGVLVPDSLEWFITFEYDDIGYVSDAEKNNLDGDAILASIRTGTEQSNAYRRQRGWPEMNVTGWKQPPFYDQATNHLIWSIMGGDGTEEVVNHNTRFLGRNGVMSANLVSGPESIDAVVPVVQEIFAGFNFKEGQRYSEWRSGDKVAAYGLSALIVGGGTALAAKSGLLAKFGKFIVIGVVGIGAWISRLLFGNKQSS